MRVLATDRLTLRWFDERDAEAVRELVNDPSWIANIGDRGIRTTDDARAFITDSLVAGYWRHGHGLWAVDRKSDGALVGMCGLVARDSLPAIDVGYALASRFRGNGYAREAAHACLRYGRDVLGRSRILAIVGPTNAPSIRVLESLGMALEETRVLPGETRDTAVYAWGGPAQGPGDARAEIDALARRFFAAFTNRGAPPVIASVPGMFLPEAVVTTVRPSAAGGAEVSSVRGFVAPRAALLLDGRLTNFAEHEVASDTEIVGYLAHRSSRYEKSGTLDGVAFTGAGHKHFQLVHTARGWKIAALSWEDAQERHGERTG